MEEKCPFCKNPCKQKWCGYERFRKDRKKVGEDRRTD
jgi:hypothetical protein